MKTLSDIMSRNMVVLHLRDGLSQAERLFKLHNIRHLPVMKGDKLIGMLSLTDLQRLSFADNFEAVNPNEAGVDRALYNMIGIAQVMTQQVESVQISQSIPEVAAILAKREFHALPVLEGDKLVGIVTTTDLIRLLAEHYQDLQQHQAVG
jgi:CBS domain-containing protein